jgi:tetratricopeptide (TPR) repeat protein
MKGLEPSDIHCVLAASGWLDLKNPAEARNELDQVSAEAQKHPDVLEMRWMICENLGDWPGALVVSREIIQSIPEEASGWLHQSYALRRAAKDGLRHALKSLMAASHLFPEEPLVAYNLACYETQLGHLTEAWDWLLKANSLLGKKKLLQLALSDPDLEPFRDRLRNL